MYSKKQTKKRKIASYTMINELNGILWKIVQRHSIEIDAFAFVLLVADIAIAASHFQILPNGKMSFIKFH